MLLADFGGDAGDGYALIVLNTHKGKASTPIFGSSRSGSRRPAPGGERVSASFAPAGRVFKEWVSIPKPDRRRWRALLREGVAHVG